MDTILNTVNLRISNFADSGAKMALSGLSDFSFKMSVCSFIGILLLSLFPYLNKLIQIPVVVFAFSSILRLSIVWHQHHRKSIKEFLFNKGIILFLLCPSILYFLSPADQKVQLLYILKRGHLTLGTQNIFVMQGFWCVIILFGGYSMLWLITTPIYLSLFVSISLMSVGIKFIEKHINKHILDVVIGGVPVLKTLFDAFKK